MREENRKEKQGGTLVGGCISRQHHQISPFLSLSSAHLAVHKFTSTLFPLYPPMDPIFWSRSTQEIDFGTPNDGCSVNDGFKARTRTGSSSSFSLVLDNMRGELVESTLRLQRKGASAERSIAALKNHSEAERKRRARINAHLDTLRSLVPGAKKMDKASLLAEVISHLKELKKNMGEAGESFLIPMDIDQVTVESQKDRLHGAPYSIKASLCCDYKPGLLSDLRRAFDALHLMITSAEIATLGSRMKNVFVIVRHGEGDVEDDGVCLLAASIENVLRSVLNKFSGPGEFSI